MITLNDFMKMSPEELASIQYKHYKDFILSQLELFVKAIKSDNLDIDKLPTFESPSGDGMGMDNTCIDFAMNGWDGDPVDIYNAFTRLKSLKELSKKYGKEDHSDLAKLRR